MNFARYNIEHETRYIYTAPVSQSGQLARLTPRGLPWQTLLQQSIQIDPPPDERHDARDSFGNTVTHFGLNGEFTTLSFAIGLVETVPAGESAEVGLGFLYADQGGDVAQESMSWHVDQGTIYPRQEIDVTRVYGLSVFVKPSYLIPCDDSFGAPVVDMLDAYAK